MYIQVEHPEVIVRGEQVGIRVTVFNHSKKVIDERRPNLKDGETPFGWKGD